MPGPVWIGLGIALGLVVLWQLPEQLVRQATGHHRPRLDDEALVAAITEERRTILAALAACGAAIGLWYTHQRQSLDRDSNRTDRYTRAVEQLGDDAKPAVQLGGVFALERVAQDSPRDHDVAFDVLSAFIRQRCAAQATANQNRGPAGIGWWSPGEPVLAALTVIQRNPDVSLQLARWRAAGASLPGVDLSDADLTRADLSDADLTNARLPRADLSGANLSRADLTGADLTDVVFNGICFVGDTEDRITGGAPQGTDLTGANLTGVHAEGASLVGANLRGARLAFVDLSDSLLLGADLSGAKLTQADLARAHSPEARYVGAQLREADLHEANLAAADFSEADLSRADLRGARLQGARLVGANLTGATLRGAHLGGADLTGADLTGADLTGVDLTDVKGHPAAPDAARAMAPSRSEA